MYLHFSSCAAVLRAVTIYDFQDVQVLIAPLEEDSYLSVAVVEPYVGPLGAELEQLLVLVALPDDNLAKFPFQSHK